MTPTAARVVVVGGGFGGLYAAAYLARADIPRDRIDIQLISDRNYFTFTPLLAEVVAGSLGREDVIVPLRPYAQAQGFGFAQAHVEGVDLAANVVHTDHAAVPYDFLVLATGATPQYFGNRSLQEASMPFATLQHALAIREHLIRTAEIAAQESNLVTRERLLSFVIAGAGPAGVEIASEIWLMLHQILPKYYGVHEPPRVSIIEGSSRILNGWDEHLSQRGLDILRTRGIDVHLGTRVRGFDGQVVTAATEDGDRALEAGTLIWTAGTAPHVPNLHGSVAQQGSGHADVNDSLCLKDHENVLVVGDAATLVDARSGKRYPPVAPIAISQGVRAASNVENALMGRALEPYHAHHAGKIVSLGGGAALVDILGLRFGGRLAWATYRMAYLLKLVGTKNKLRAATSLALNHLFDRDLTCELEGPQSGMRTAHVGAGS